MPVFNGEAYLKNALDSLLTQTFSDFELIISDNASTDNTKEICEQYAKNDARIRYIRQVKNLGPTMNFKFVLDQAVGEFFMWAAADDIRSSDFIEVNLKFLKDNPDYVASTSPNGFEGVELSKQILVNFKLDGEIFERFTEFFKNCWVSHGIYYSLIRASTLRGCQILGQSFIAADWAINLYLVSKGKVNRTLKGYTIIGVKGVSSGADAYKAFRNDYIEFLIPFYRLSKYVLALSADFSVLERIKIIIILLKLNIKAVFNQIWALPYSIYFKYIRPIVRKKQITV